MLRKGIYTVTTMPADPELVVLTRNNVLVRTKPIRIAAIRGYLLDDKVAQYTLNAVVRIAKFVAGELDLQYTIPTDLSGTPADDKKILPDDIALGIVLLQAHKGIPVDGFAGADFIRKVMGLHQDLRFSAHCRAAFMDESSNKIAVTGSGQRIIMPDFKASETVAYDFLRNITLVRNGLWSDRPNIVNLTGIRLVKGNASIQWDDTISVCWVDSTGKKHAKVYTATTEPGNRKLYKNMLPQTIIFYPGYHQGKQPALRGHRTMAFDPTKNNPDRLIFNTDDARGLNMHSGGTVGAMKSLVKYILPVGANNETELRAVLVFMEIFRILSRWGLDATRPAWENLSGWAAAKALRAGPISGSSVPIFQDEKTAAVRSIYIPAARGWLAKKWANNRPILLKILRSVEPSFNPPPNFNQLNTAGLETVISNQHILGIAKRQCDYFFDAKKVDGLAGNTYLALLNAEIPDDGALAQLANKDFARMNELLKLSDGGNTVLTTTRKNYVKKIITQTLLERAKFVESEAIKGLEASGQKIKDLVGTWSILCQVVFGPEMFYEMMEYALRNILETGQRRLYYTLIDEATVPKA
jgi:hypothetical protein